MAMPVSGSIAIISAPQTCGSICAAVGIASGSLCTLSISAARPTPYCMRNFYGYVKKSVSFCLVSQSGTIGSSGAVSGVFCICRTPAMVAGECFYINLGGNLSTVQQAAGSFACVLVYCNGTLVNSCTLTTQNVCCPSLGFPPTGCYLICSTTTMCVIACASTTNTLCASGARAGASIANVTSVSGSFTTATPTACDEVTG